MGGVNQITHRAKKLTMFFAIMLTILVTLPEEGKAQGNCPSGYTARTVTFNVNGSYYKVFYCYRCSSSTHSGPDILLNGWETDDDDLPWPGLYDLIQAEVIQDLSAICGPYPPCDQTVTTFHITSYSCFSISNVLFAPPLPWPPPYDSTYKQNYCKGNSGGEFRRYASFCDDANYCLTILEVCFDYTENEIVINEVDKQQYGAPGCDTTTPIPPIGKTWCDPWVSECYSIWGCED